MFQQLTATDEDSSELSKGLKNNYLASELHSIFPVRILWCIS